MEDEIQDLNVENELIALHNNASYVFSLYTEDCKFINCSNSALKIFDLVSKKYVEDLTPFFPKLQPDGSDSFELVEKNLKQCAENGCANYQFMMEKLDGSQLPVCVVLKKLKIKDKTFIASFHFSLVSHHISQRQVELRNKLLNAINKISELTLSFCEESITNDSDMDEIMHKILTILGQAGRADRCFVWENYYPPDSSLLYMRQIYEWAEGVDYVQGTELIDNITYEPNLYDLLSAGNTLNAIVKDLDDYNKMILEEQGIKSILISPVHIDDNFWGFIGFDNCQTEELWDSFEEEILAIAAHIIAKMIVKFTNTVKKNSHSL